MKLFTIGYSAYDREAFAEELKKHGVDMVVDVRSVPASKYRPEYNGERLDAYLKRQGVEYRHMPEAFGARRTDREYLNEEGWVDFGLFSHSHAFLSGVDEIAAVTKQGKNCALMCAEKDALTCHRAVLIGRKFYELGWQVIHIMPDRDETQEQLEERLLDEYFPERNQFSLLEKMKTDEELLPVAYWQQNRRIGFRKEE